MENLWLLRMFCIAKMKIIPVPCAKYITIPGKCVEVRNVACNCVVSDLDTRMRLSDQLYACQFTPREVLAVHFE
jgi:hypothetical protein